MATPTYDEVKAHLIANPEGTANIVLTTLAIAGTLPEWDSETIEWVLGSLQDAVPKDTPPVGAEGAEGEYLKWWREAADVLGLDYEVDEEN